MADLKRFLDYEGLQTLWGKINAADEANALAASNALQKAESAQTAAEAAQSAADNAQADATAGLQAAAGAQSTADQALANAATADAKAVDATTLAEEASTAATAAGNAAIKAQETADKAQEDLDALEELVGTRPADAAENSTVFDYIVQKTSGIATDENLKALTDRVTQTEKDIDAIEADYLKGSDKTELENKITAVDDAVKLLTDGAGTDEIDSVKELITYVNEHGAVVTGLQDGIDKNAEDIATINEKLATVEENAEVNIIETVKRNGVELTPDENRAVDIIVPTGALADKDKVAEADLETELASKINAKVDTTTYEAKVEALEDADEAQVERIAALEAKFGDGEGSVEELIAAAKQEAIDAAAEDASTKAGTAESNAKTHADNLNTAMNTRVEALEAIDHDHANKAELDSITGALMTSWSNAEGNAKAYADTLAKDKSKVTLETVEKTFSFGAEEATASGVKFTVVNEKDDATETKELAFYPITADEIEYICQSTVV